MDDHMLKPEDFEQEGSLAGEAARIIMKALYGARLVRYELLWPICSIAREVSRWTRACDKRLHRLISYIHHTIDHSLESFVGDPPELCHPIVYTDADFAGDTISAKSTSGAYLAIAGPNTFAPITAVCKKQTCVSHSSTESEIVAAEHAVRTEGLQALAFWEEVVSLLGTNQKEVRKSKETCGQPNSLELNPYSANSQPGKYFAYTRRKDTVTDLIIAEDNEAVIKIVKKARSLALRHLPRTHRIDVRWLYEVCADPHVKMLYVGTKEQVADLMTKALNKPETWYHLLDIAQIRGGITSQQAKSSIAAVLSLHAALPISAAHCVDCGFNITLTNASCPCMWN
jgi:hypothetical protein